MTNEFSLGPKRRIKRRGDFLRIQSKGSKHHASTLLLAVSDRREQDIERFGNEWRIGITITKKVDKRAARRNKLRRRLKEVFRLERKNLLGCPKDIVVIAKQGACERPFEEIRSEFRYLLKRAKLLGKNVPNKSNPE